VRVLQREVEPLRRAARKANLENSNNTAHVTLANPCSLRHSPHLDSKKLQKLSKMVWVLVLVRTRARMCVYVCVCARARVYVLSTHFVLVLQRRYCDQFK
jgi:hypothetical protein